MLATKCNIYNITPAERTVSSEAYDFNSLVPQAEPCDYEVLQQYAEKQKESQGMDVLPPDLYSQMLENCLERRDFRSTFFLVAMANFGLRHSDVVKLRRIDLIDEHNRIREKVLIQEKKTSKQRIVFINDAVKMALLMLLNNSSISPTDYLISSNGNRKGYELETYIDQNGKTKTLRINGKYVFKLDENGNRIPKPLSRSQSENIMKDIIIENLGYALKNDKRCKDEPDCIGKICTHSIRKLYGWAVTQAFINQFDSDIAYAHAAALSFLSQDYGHSSTTMTLHYSKDFDNLKRQINLSMNLGADVLEKYFAEEAKRWASNLTKKQ